MRKYLALARAESLDVLQEKGEMFIWFLLDLIPLLVMGSLWISNGSELLGESGTKMLVTYYFVVLVTSRLTDIWFDGYIQENIRNGQFSKWLLKPLAIPFMYIPDNIGSKLVSVSITLLPTMMLLAVFLGKYLIIPNFQTLFFFGLALVNAYVLKFVLGVFVAATAFFWEQSRAVLHAKWVAETVFGGYILPLSFYPVWLQWLPNILPFKNIYYVPASIYTEVFNIGQAMTALWQGGVWSGILLAVSLWFWKKGIKKYSGVGG